MYRSLVRRIRPLINTDIAKLARYTPVLTDAIEKYTSEWFGRTGLSTAVLRPQSNDELSSIMRYCDSERIGVTIVGGNTGLVGATLSSAGELMVSLERMNRIIGVDSTGSTATVEAGVILETLQQALSKHGLTTPYDLGARGSCTVGGNISTNAGGINFIRYGPLRGHVVGVEVVLPNGEILDLMSECWKDNSGVDLKQLFIGSEGTLGVITKARLHCPPLPQFKSVALLQVPGGFSESVLEPMKLARQTLSESLSAFEFMDSEGMGLVSPLPDGLSEGSFTVLVEVSGSGPVGERLQSFLEALPGDQIEGVVASDIESMKKLWHFRESLPVKMAQLGPNLKYDVSLPQSHFYSLVEAVRAEYSRHPDVLKVVGYGHVADSNLHLNIALKSPNPSLSDKVSNFVYPRVADLKGSISAEHGIGRDKLNELPLVRSANAVRLIRELKKQFDPNGILNPGRTIPTLD